MSIKALQQLIKLQNDQLLSSCACDDELIENTKKMHKKRGADIVRSVVTGRIIRTTKLAERMTIDYKLRNERLIEMGSTYYLEESERRKRAYFQNGHLLMEKDYEEQIGHPPTSYFDERSDQIVYDRDAAVRYAELWWDDYNPNYRRFPNNCTNFVSQCLQAGGAPMNGAPNREKGWWYSTESWSYSWAVAHSFRWYLSEAKTGLRGIEKERASDLERGDVICYDFNGDGKWQHTTIVVAHDANGEPLVNAQTYNSRMRYWAYEDSTAWTPNIRYKFFHILI